MTMKSMQLTAGEVMAAFANVPSFTPVSCHVDIKTGLLDGDTVSLHEVARVTGVRTVLNGVVLEVEV